MSISKNNSIFSLKGKERLRERRTRMYYLRFTNIAY